MEQIQTLLTKTTGGIVTGKVSVVYDDASKVRDFDEGDGEISPVYAATEVELANTSLDEALSVKITGYALGGIGSNIIFCETIPANTTERFILLLPESRFEVPNVIETTWLEV